MGDTVYCKAQRKKMRDALAEQECGRSVEVESEHLEAPVPVSLALME